MPWQWTCDGCGYVNDRLDPLDNIDPMVNCEDCGTDGCVECLPDAVCEDCQRRRARANEEDGE